MESIARRITVKGRVQGVGFRAFVMQHVQRLGVDGFVRNRKDGSVEVLCVGDEAQVDEMITLCYTGPTAARVQEVDVQPAQGIVDKGFKQLPTV